MDIAVIYLYYIPYKIEVLQTFVHSLLQNESGLSYRLYIIFKDASDTESIQLSKEWLQTKNINYTELHFKGGFDIDAYYFGANQISADYLVFFNSNSKILHNNWLLHLANAISANVCAVGATGSWQSYYEVVHTKAKLELGKPQPFSMKWQMFKLLLKSVLHYKRWFSKFPNPHLRTNALLIKRELFMKVNVSLPIKKKIDAYRFESGKNSLTNQLMRLGYDVCIVDKSGSTYLPKDWDRSNIFWMGTQQNLLVSDNQTLLYENGDLQVKKQLSFFAWGV